MDPAKSPEPRKLDGSNRLGSCSSMLEAHGELASSYLPGCLFHRIYSGFREDGTIPQKGVLNSS